MQESPLNAADKFVDIARVQSPAEAGYLLSMLQAEGIDASTREEQSFNAITGAWAAGYVIATPTEEAAEAASILRPEAQALEEDAELAAAEDLDREVFQAVIWRPFALMALAGVVSFFLGQRFAEPERSPRADPLVRAALAIGKPFYAQKGGTQHRLSYDKKREHWRLDTDTNGDQRFDQTRYFATAPAN